LRHLDEVWELGLEEALGEGISLIEWPDVARDRLPAAQTLELALSPGTAPEARRADAAGGTGWTPRLATFAPASPQ
jgi:tRNA A37 threonylcarbamoyladenosine biosynthesis protein TsaE